MRRYLNLSVAMVAIVLLIVGTQMRSAAGIAIALTAIGAVIIGALTAALDRAQEREQHWKERFLAAERAWRDHICRR